MAMFFATFATVGQITIIGKQVFDLTGSELDLGLLGLAEFVPLALLAPIVGATADRFDRRLVYGAGLAGDAVVSLGFFLYIRSEPTSVAPIFALVVVFGVARAFTGSSSRALAVDIAPAHHLERVIALQSVAFQAAIIAGPVLYGFLFVVDPAAPYLVSVLGYGVAMVLLATLVTVPTTTRLATHGVRQALVDAREGLRFIRGTPVLFGAISLDLFAVLFGGAVALLPAIAEERLGVGAVGLGWLRAAVGVGAGIVALFLSVKPLRRRVGPTLLCVVAVFGLATIVLGLTRSYAVAFVAIMVLAGADAVSMFIRASLVPLATPAAMRGRVLAVEHVFIGASNELGAVESGLAAAALGLVGGVVSGGVGCLVVVVIWWWRFPELARVDRFAEVRRE